MSLSLGIDFGTTTTLVSIREEGTLPRIMPIGENGRLYMPSAIAFLENANGAPDILFGERALRVSTGAPVIKSIKRCLNCKGDRCMPADATRDARRSTGWRAAHLALCRNGKIAVGGREWLPEELAFLIVEEALNRALRQLRAEQPDDMMVHWTGSPANIGCPAAFTLGQRQLL